jgi:hypothetical protein
MSGKVNSIYYATAYVTIQKFDRTKLCVLLNIHSRKSLSMTFHSLPKRNWYSKECTLLNGRVDSEYKNYVHTVDLGS